MRNRNCAALMVLIACSFAVTASAQMVPMRQGYVSDYAGVLSIETQQQLARDLGALRSRDGVELNVVIIDSLKGYSVEVYSRTMANNWHIGEDLGNRGVLLLFAPSERKVRIEVGRGLVSVLPDVVTSRIIQSTIAPPWKSGDRERAVAAGVSALTSELDRSVAPAVSATPTQSPVMQRMVPVAPLAGTVPVATDATGADSSSLGTSFVIGLGALSAFGIFLLFLHRRNIAAENRNKLRQCNERMEMVRAQHTDAQNTMIDLQTNNPVEIWQEMRQRLNEVASRDLDHLELTLRGIHTSQRRGLGQQASVRERIGVWMAETDNILAIFQTIFALRKNLEEADVEVARLRQDVPKRLEVLKEEIAHLDVSAKTRKIADEQAAQLKEIERYIRTTRKLSELNMLVLHSQLICVQSVLEGAINRAKEEKEQAQHARTQVPVLLKHVGDRLAHASRDHNVQYLSEARRQYEEAQTLASGGTDWALAYMLLNNASHNCDRAVPPPPPPIHNHYEDPSPSFAGHGITATLPDFSPDPSPISTPDFSSGFDGSGSSGDL